MTKLLQSNIPGSVGQYVHPKSTYVLGCDFARRGKDESAFVILEKPFTSEEVFITFVETLHTPDLMAAIARIVHLDKMFDFKRIYLDETGLGAGPTDLLKNELGGKVEGITFTRNSKAEMFTNLKLLMSRKQKRLYIPNYLFSNNAIVKKMYFQFLTIRQEFTEGSEVPKIFHEDNKHDDIICALALAASYFSTKPSHRNLFQAIGLKR